jgi:hypothetical protein
MVIMGRVGKLIPSEQVAIAEKNGIPLTTVYKRLQRGWDVEEAITKPPKERKLKHDEEGQFTGIGKGKPRSFTLPIEWDEIFDLEVKESNQTQSEWISEAVINQLKRIKKGSRQATKKQ